jgi:hypothetical protein
MLKAKIKSILSLVAVIVLCTCIDPYTPKLKGYESLLVVEGLVTDQNTSYTITLSRTFMEQDATPLPVTDATVYITDNEANSTYLRPDGSGKYKTDSLQFRGITGKTYVLHILTGNGVIYESDPCTMLSIPDISSIYYEKEQALVNNGTQTEEGIGIYLDSKEGGNTQYYRWAFEETWKFKVPYPKRYDYNMADSSFTMVKKVKEYCWKNRKSDEILLHAVYEGQPNLIQRVPVTFIASKKSDRLLLQYSILVSQYSVSKAEYEFWNNLKQVNTSGGDIFARQPYTVISNIHNINNPQERVLGYFQVSAVRQQRKNITNGEITALNLPYYHNSCETWIKEPGDYSNPWGPPWTWNMLYDMFCNKSDYVLVQPLYVEGTNEYYKMVFTRPECANCELTGTGTKPDFWIDLK